MQARAIVPNWLADYHAESRTLATSALAVLPLMLLYGLGLMFASPEARSSLDVVSGRLHDALPIDVYVALQLGGAVLIGVAATWHLRTRLTRAAVISGPLIAEAALYGVFMGSAILFVLDELALLGPTGTPDALLDRAVISAGAGLHEELVFRLLLIPALILLFRRVFDLPWVAAVLIAAITSALAFAAAHHLAGEPWDAYRFAYRSLAGVLFAALFLFRGFAVAVWTHAAYDFYVLA